MQFHNRMVRNSEAAAERFERRAAESTSAATTERFFAKAQIEWRNAEHHRELLIAIAQNSIIGN